MADLSYLFVQRDAGSSVYTAVAKYLQTREDKSWKKVPKDSTRFNLMLGDRNKLPYSKLGQIRGLTQVVNYYRGSDVICRKASLVRTLKDYCEEQKLRMFEWMPTSFVIYPPCDQEVVVIGEEKLVRQRRSRSDERDQLKKCAERAPHVIWIAKSSNGAKGDGIQISSDVGSLVQMVDSQKKAYVIQQYIDSPLLLSGGRKFDIRCWVLIDATYTIYLYREGVLRTASEEYEPDRLDHLTAHLTNHALQQELSENFGKYEVGNEMFYDEFDSFLQDKYGVGLDTAILPQIRSIVKTCLGIVQSKLNTTGLDYWSFQLLGFDFMVDSDLKVWLLEVNGAPACAQKLLSGLVQSLVETAIDPVFVPYGQVQYGPNLFDQI
ncbi:tubulin--tyrosine ligase-like [Haliotis rubra]|uniref:tubulin--tyrosine ligase-like n=1 Tax=Haliotis rubra TaxID=36100 RepID=UPI001EE61FB3|nr:tubulin--tyrosine ligase-like [Haliotis rubra]XP_046578238.1 tubulin--tyrosine ligase-like [Haliotis rubra]